MGLYWSERHESTLEWTIKNGKMGITTKGEVNCPPYQWPGPPLSSSAALSDMFDIGWNYMWYTIGTSRVGLLNYQHFKSPGKSDNANLNAFRSMGRVLIGGAIEGK